MSAAALFSAFSKPKRSCTELSQPRIQDYYVSLGYSCLIVVWGGIFLCSVCYYGSLINNSFREYLLDLSERKLELLARSKGSDIDATEAALTRTVAAIDTVIHRCQWYNDTEG